MRNTFWRSSGKGLCSTRSTPAPSRCLRSRVSLLPRQSYLLNLDLQSRYFHFEELLVELQLTFQTCCKTVRLRGPCRARAEACRRRRVSGAHVVLDETGGHFSGALRAFGHASLGAHFHEVVSHLTKWHLLPAKLARADNGAGLALGLVSLVVPEQYFGKASGTVVDRKAAGFLMLAD